MTPSTSRGSVAVRLLATVAAVGLLVAGAFWWWTSPSRWREDDRPPPGFEAALDAFDAGDIQAGLDRLARIREQWTHPGWDARADFLIGLRAARNKRDETAAEALGRIHPPGAGGDRPFPLAARAAVLRAGALVRLGRHREAAAWIEPVAERHRSYSAGEDALEQRALALAGDGRGREAIDRIETLLASAELHSPGRFVLLVGRLHLDAGDPATAAEHYKTAWAEHPTSVFASRALDRLEELPGEHGDWTKDDLERVRLRAALLEDADRPGALSETWELAIERIPGAREDPEVRLRYGIALAFEGRTRDAGEWLEGRSGIESVDLQAVLARGEIAVSRGWRTRAKKILEPLLDAGAPEALRGKAHLMLAAAADRAGQSGTALAHYRAAIPVLPATWRADHAAWRAGWLAFRAGRHGEAVEFFKRLDRPDCHPGYQAAGLYWRARAEESRRRFSTARSLLRQVHERFRNEYYGLRAAVRLGEDPPPAARARRARAPEAAGTADDSADDTLPPPPDPRAYDPPAREAVEAARELEALRLTRSARIEYLFALRHAPDDRELNLRVADLALSWGDRAAAQEFLRSAYTDLPSMDTPALPARHRRALYPLEAWEDIRAAAAERSLDPYLVCALILQESEFNPLAVSRAGALGLMQIVPATGRDMARFVGARDYDRERLFEPGFNIVLGTAYLSDLLRRYDGRIEPTLAAYNAGPNRASRWWRRSNGDEEAFVEQIPFTETRLYVKRVLGNLKMYSLLYGPEDSSRTG